jgi:hypothetical protein
MATANFGLAPVAGAAAAVPAANNDAAANNATWGTNADESFLLATVYWTKLYALKEAWMAANALATGPEKLAALKKLPYLVDLVPRGGSRKKRQSKKRKNQRNHNNNQ